MATILVADDDTAIRTLLKAVLVSAGHFVHEASNGLEAVAVFRSYADSIDVVVIDMVMPVMSGAQAIARIRETRPGVPVVCVSGFSDVETPPATSFLAKPFVPKDLLGLLDHLLGSA